MKHILYAFTIALLITSCSKSSVTPPIDDPKEEENQVPECG